MAKPRDVLSELAYKNYRNVRAAALLFIIVGSILFLGGIAVATKEEPERRMHPALAIGIGVVGLCGVVGGIATRRGSRSWAPLVKVMAWLYIWAFPIGTILSWTLLDGLSQYLKSIDRIRRAEEQENDEWGDEQEDWDDEEEEDDRPKKRRRPRD